MGPWEKYAAQPAAPSGPWAKYAPQSDDPVLNPEQGGAPDIAKDPQAANWRDSQPPEGMTLDPISGQMRDPEMRARANPQSVPQGMMRTAQQGLGFSGGDEFNAGIAAAEDWATGRAGFGEAYDSRLADERAMLDKFRSDHPVAAYGSELAGAVATPGAAMKAGATTGANALRMGAAGAASGAAYGFGAGEGGAIERGKSAAVGGALGGATGAAVPFVLKGAQNALARMGTRKAIDAAADAAPALDDVKAGSQSAYRAAREMNVAIKPEATMPLVNEIAEIRTLHKRFTPDANGLIDDILTDLSKGEVPLGALEDLHRSAGMAVNKNRIGNPQDAAAAGQIAQKIDEYMMNLPDEAVSSAKGDVGSAVEAFKEGRAMWKSFRNSEKLQDVVAKAEMSENPAGAVRSGFRAILTNKNKRATYSPAEIQVMRQVMRDSKAGGWVQRMIGYGTGLSRQAVGIMAGSALGGPVGAAMGSAAATKIGSVAKEAANEATLKAADRAARFSAAGGQYAVPPPQMLPGFGNALTIGSRGAAPAGVNLWNR
jgi:hypothetical protein